MLSKNLEISLHRALALAKKHSHEYATLEHLLYALGDDPDAAAVMQGCGLDIARIKQNIGNFLDNELNSLIVEDLDESKPTAGFQRVIHRAAIHVQSAGKHEVTGANVLVALFSERDSHAVYFLQEQDVNRLDVVNYISHGIMKYQESASSLRAVSREIEEEAEALEKPAASSGKDKESADALSQYCVNLNKRAESGKTDILVGREAEVDRAIQVLCRRSKTTHFSPAKQALAKPPLPKASPCASPGGKCRMCCAKQSFSRLI